MPGERLLSRLVGQDKEEFILACFADRRIRRTTLAKVSGYSVPTLRWLVRDLQNKRARVSRKQVRTIDDVYQALIICAAQVHSRTLGYEGYLQLGYEPQTCESGRCDETMVKVQALFNRRGVNAAGIARALGKSRPWFYANKQSAMCECQTATRCENWELILNAANN